MPDWELLHTNAANSESRRLIERLAGWDFEIDGADWEGDAVDRLDWGWPADAVDRLDWGWPDDAVDRLDWGWPDDAVVQLDWGWPDDAVVQLDWGWLDLDWLDWEIPEISE